MRILIVEDDRSIASGLDYSLRQEGYTTRVCSDMASAQQVIEEELVNIDLCLLDLSLPDGSGYDLCEQIKQKRDTPVIFLTAFDDEVNVVMGLDMGADDYITKPFRIRELVSRINSVLRRYQRNSSEESTLNFKDIYMQPLKGKVWKGDLEINLTALEYQLFMVLMKHQGQILSRAQLLERIWDVAGDFVNDNTLTVYIKRLRKKLEDNPQDPELIKTVRGLGYKLGD